MTKSNSNELLRGPNQEWLVRTGERRAPKKGEMFIRKNGVTDQAPFDYGDNMLPNSFSVREILRPATPSEISAHTAEHPHLHTTIEQFSACPECLPRKEGDASGPLDANRTSTGTATEAGSIPSEPAPQLTVDKPKRAKVGEAAPQIVDAEQTRKSFEKWCKEEMNADPENLERLTGGRGSYRVHNVHCWWMGWKAAIQIFPPVQVVYPFVVPSERLAYLHRKNVEMERTLAAHVARIKNQREEIKRLATPDPEALALRIAQAFSDAEFFKIAMKHRSTVAGYQFSDKFDFEAIAAELRAVIIESLRGSR